MDRSRDPPLPQTERTARKRAQESDAPRAVFVWDGRRWHVRRLRVIEHDLSADEIRQFLEGPGVQYVRDDVAPQDKRSSRPPPLPSAPDVEPD